MRVTDLSMERDFLYNIFKTEERLGQLQNQAYSGQSICRPQDDPIGTARSIYLRHDLSVSKQYLRNIDKARNWMSQTEQALSHLTDRISRAHQLALYGSTGTTPPNARAAIAAEVKHLSEEAESILQTTIDGRNLLTGTMPEWRLADDVTIRAKGLDDLQQVAQVLKDLAEKFEADGDEFEDIQDLISQIDEVMDRVLSERAENGAKLRRLDILEDKSTSLDIEYQRLLSNVEDVDIIEVLVRLKSQEAAYQAALAAGARLIQPSLLEHLR